MGKGKSKTIVEHSGKTTCGCKFPLVKAGESKCRECEGEVKG